jgi:threonine synthase
MTDTPTLFCQVCSSRVPIGPMFYGCSVCGQSAGVYPLEVDYDYDGLRAADVTAAWGVETANLWSFRSLLPLPVDAAPVSLVEGGTPLIRLDTNGPGNIWIKDETRNPTGAHKDRFHSVSVSMARHLGFSKITAATTGNHGLSAAAYAARARMQSLIFCDPQSPLVLRDLINFFGGRVAVLAERTKLLEWLVDNRGWYPSTTLTPAPVGTPYGVEGYKTIAFELFLQLGRRLPTYVVAPVAGGDLFYGIWKGFRELRRIAEMSDRPPSMIAAQSAECDPVVQGFRVGAREVPHVEPHTIALSIGDSSSTPVSLSAIYESGGTAESVPDDGIVAATRLLAQAGLATEPAGAVSLAVALAQQARGVYKRDDDIVCVMTGAAVKWPDTIALGMDRHVLADSDLVAVRAWIDAGDLSAVPKST